AATPDMPADTIYFVTEVYPQQVVLDGNHPLAGKALRIHLKVVDVREASAEEIEARSVGSSALGVLGAPKPPDGSLLH
ncbi:MAG: peptidylprolyl isomerase, partial [Chitinophagaceae bacterium]|nr:peptidylprolyl isomerase [Rubrivivax sp.]